MQTIITSLKLSFVIIQVFVMAACNSNAQNTTISIDEFEKGIQQKEVQLLDVRTAEEYQSGHLAHALQADWNNDEQFQERTKALDKTKPLYVYCLSGGRSNAAMNWLLKNGFTKVYNMKGGINAWNQGNKAIEGQAQVAQISMQDYANLIAKDKTVLVDFSAEWCPPCKKMNPLVQELEKQHYIVVKVDGGSQTTLCKQLKVSGFPTFIIYKNGVEVKRASGLLTMKQLKELFN